MSQTVEILDEDDVNSAIQSALEKFPENLGIQSEMQEFFGDPPPTEDEVRDIACVEARAEFAKILDPSSQDDIWSEFRKLVDAQVESALKERAAAWRCEKDALITIKDLAQAQGSPKSVLERIVALVTEALL